jgi:hypothetical protein
MTRHSLTLSQDQSCSCRWHNARTCWPFIQCHKPCAHPVEWNSSLPGCKMGRAHPEDPTLDQHTWVNGLADNAPQYARSAVSTPILSMERAFTKQRMAVSVGSPLTGHSSRGRSFAGCWFLDVAKPSDVDAFKSMGSCRSRALREFFYVVYFVNLIEEANMNFRTLGQNSGVESRKIIPSVRVLSEHKTDDIHWFLRRTFRLAKRWRQSRLRHNTGRP